MNSVLFASTIFVFLYGEAQAGYKSYWANKTLPIVKPDRCGKNTGTDQNWTERPDAYACEDDIGSDNCQVFLDGTAIFIDPKNAKRSALCDNPYFQDAANRCRKTCGTCCESEKFTSCKNNVTTFDCLKIAVNADAIPAGSGTGATPGKTATVNLCGSPDFRSIILYACPSTCGLCDVYKTKSHLTPGQQHVDHAKEKNKKKKPQIDPAKLKIPRTKNCKDNIPKNKNKGYCKRRMYSCEEGKHMDAVRKACNFTCALCIPKNFVCEDLDVAKCERWKKRDFCLNGEYPLSAKLHHCAKTCEMCPSKK